MGLPAKPLVCGDCSLNAVCRHAFWDKSSVNNCWFDVNKGVAVEKEKILLKHEFLAFVGKESEPLLAKMMLNYRKLEKEADEDPSYTKYIQLQYMLMALYKLKFGSESQSASSHNVTNITFDVKKKLDEFRAKSVPGESTESGGSNE